MRDAPRCPVCGTPMLPSPSLEGAWLCERFCGGVLTDARLGELNNARWEQERPRWEAEQAERRAAWKNAMETLPWAYYGEQVRTLWTVEGMDGWHVVTKEGGFSAVDVRGRKVLSLRSASQRDVLTRCQAVAERKEKDKKRRR